MSVSSPDLLAEIEERVKAKRSFVSTEGDKEYLFSFCPACSRTHKRQQVIRLSDEHMARWNKPQPSKLFGKYRVPVAVLTLITLGYVIYLIAFALGEEKIRGLSPVHMIVFAVLFGCALLIGHLSDNAIQRNQRIILAKYGEFDLDRVGTVAQVDPDDWEPDSDENYDYIVMKSGVQP